MPSETAANRLVISLLRMAQEVCRKLVLPIATGVKSPGHECLSLLVMLDLIQDLDLLLPVIIASSKVDQIEVNVGMTRRLDRRSPRTLQVLKSYGLPVKQIHHRGVLAGLAPDLSGISALLTASESTCGPHRVCHALTRRACSSGITTFTLQHGFENVGLTYFPVEQGQEVDFASQWILTWNDPARLPSNLSPSIRHRCIGVGRPAPVLQRGAVPPIPSWRGPVIGVFENLHWERYSDAYRGQFLDDLMGVARARPEHLFLIKPHHAGRWLIHQRRTQLEGMTNVHLIDPTDPAWEPFTASTIIPHVGAVVTTPSSVALDASSAGKAVAVVGYDLPLQIYEPLTILRSQKEWLRFLELAAGNPDTDLRRQRFLESAILPGDATPRVIAEILARSRRNQAAVPNRKD